MNTSKLQSLFDKASGFEGVFVSDPANVGYLTQVFFPFPERKGLYHIGLAAAKNDAVLILPAIWAQAAEQQGWEKIVSYDFNTADPAAAYVSAVEKAFEQTGLKKAAKIGSDAETLSCNVYAALQKTVGADAFVSCKDLIAGMRKIKSDDEIAKIRVACEVADRGLIGSLNHAEGTVNYAGYTLSEFLERVRVHAAEFKSYGLGLMNVSQGTAGKSFYTPIRDFTKLEAGKLVRVDFTNACEGYWIPCSRMLAAGTPSESAAADFAKNRSLKLYAEKLLKSGAVIKDLCAAVSAYASEQNIDFCADFGIGHGTGIQAVEEPMLCADNEEKLEEGMVIALDVFTRSYDNEMIHSIDVYQITKDGAVKLSDFKDWDELYTIDGCRNTH